MIGVERQTGRGRGVGVGGIGGGVGAQQNATVLISFLAAGGAAAPAARHGAKHTGFSFVIEGRQSNQSGGWKEKGARRIILDKSSEENIITAVRRELVMGVKRKKEKKNLLSPYFFSFCRCVCEMFWTCVKPRKGVRSSASDRCVRA